MKNNLHPVRGGKKDWYMICYYILVGIFIIVSIIALASCSTTKSKNISKSRTDLNTRTDSSSTTSNNKDSVVVKKDNSLHIITTDDSTVTETVVEFDKPQTYDTMINGRRSVIDRISGVILSIGGQKPETYSLILDGIYPATTMAGNPNMVWQPIKTITTRTTSKTKSVKVQQVVIVDSTHLRTNTATTSTLHRSTDLHIATYVKNKEVNRWNFAWLLLIPAGVFVWFKWISPAIAAARYKKSKDV